MDKIKIFFLCTLLGDHNWTSKAGEGIDPTKAELRDGVSGFFRYARMYCKRCGTISRLSL